MYEENKSTYEIAEALGTYPNKISRALKYLGAKSRTRSEAQKQALASGRRKHPTKGKTHSEETRVKISENVHSYWLNMSDEDREAYSLKKKVQWDAMSDRERDKLQKSAAKGIRDAAKNGSKMENFLRSYLTKHGYDVIFHKKGLVPNVNLEIDLFLPTLKVIIEVDGPAHFFPIWGDESLKRHIKADAEKSGLLLNAGFVIIRIKHLSKTLTEKHKRDVGELLLEEVRKIEVKFPSKKKRYIELEIE